MFTHGQSVVTPDGTIGKVAVPFGRTVADIYETGPDSLVAVYSVVCQSGEVRRYVETALEPLTRPPQPDTRDDPVLLTGARGRDDRPSAEPDNTPR